MSLTLSLTEEQIYTALRTFLITMLPTGVEVVQAQTNRVAPPQADDYVTMTSNLQDRLSTNVDSYADGVYVGSISGSTLTITEVLFDPTQPSIGQFEIGVSGIGGATGSIGIGSMLFGIGILPGTVVTQLDSGIGGVGTYTVNNAQTIDSETISIGSKQMLMPAKLTIQLDVHGPASADNTVMISAAFRDSYAIEQFSLQGFDVAPLYVSESRQIPFLNDSQQIEQRWSLDAVMQINPVVGVPQQFASALVVTPVSVDASYPP